MGLNVMRSTRYIFKFLIAIFCAGALPAFSIPQKLKIADVRPTMEEMLGFHVEYKEFTSVLAKRSFKLYIEQFDSEKMYLFQNEVKPYLELNQGRVEKAIARFHADDFSDYKGLNDIVRKAITRSRQWRQEFERELILNSQMPEVLSGESHLYYASGEDQLKQRVRKQLVRFLANERQNSDKAKWTPERRQKIFALLEKRLARLENPYILQGEIGEHYLALHILKAMAKSLDAHTSYFSPEEAFEMRASLEKQFEGVGLVLREGVDGVVVADLIKGGPAERSGKLAVGDLLIAINGRSLADVSYDEVLAAMKGDGKTEIELGIKRVGKDGQDAHHSVKLKREKIVMQEERLQYSFEPYADGIIGKLILPSFYESGGESSCEKDMREAIKSLKKQGKLVGLVIDMRENSGGFLNQAVKVAGLFITSGVIVISKYAQGEVQYLRDIDGRSYFNGPLLVLTSKGSASAAEIVAQALQDYGAALIAGDERTYGKGTIQYQTVTDENPKAFFKVTVGRYYTVSGKSTQIEGVKADILLPTEYSIYNIGERFLEYPLTSDRVPSAYVDPLSDLDRNAKNWFKKNYLPNLQKKELRWRKMLPVLSGNTRYRLEHDPDFKIFLSSLGKHTESTVPSAENNWGVEDLQMKQAVKILKDMIILNTEKSPGSTVSK